MMRGGGNKFSAKKTACQHGHMHDSAREAKRCDQLHLLQRAGKIKSLETQPQFWFVIDGKQVKHPNGRRVGYRPDFLYAEPFPPDGDYRPIAEDSKGVRTEAYVLRAALFRALFPHIELREV